MAAGRSRGERPTGWLPSFVPSPRKGFFMSPWLALVVIGVILLIVGFAGVGKILIWIGVAVLVVGAVLTLLGRGRSSINR